MKLAASLLCFSLCLPISARAETGEPEWLKKWNAVAAYMDSHRAQPRRQCDVNTKTCISVTSAKKDGSFIYLLEIESDDKELHAFCGANDWNDKADCVMLENSHRFRMMRDAETGWHILE